MAIASLQVTKTYADLQSWTEAKMDAAMQSIQTYTKVSVVNNFNQVIADAFSATYSLDNDGVANYPTPVRTIAVVASLNAQQLRKDVFGATYTLDGDGTANNTNTLYKEVWGRSYTGNLPRKLYTEIFGKDASSTARTKSFYAEAWGASPTTIAAVRTNSLYNKQSAVASYNTTINLSTTVVGWTEASPNLRLIFSPEATGKYLISYHFSHRYTISNGGVLDSSLGIFNRTANATLTAVRSFMDFVHSGSDDIAFCNPVYLSYIHNFSSTAVATFSLYYRVSQAATVSGHQLFAVASHKTSIYGQIHKI